MLLRYRRQKSNTVDLLARSVFLALLVLVSEAAPQDLPRRKTIRKINVEGLRRTSEEKLLSRLRIRIGEVYDPTKARRETARLYSLGQFRRVEGPLVTELEDNVEIKFVVEEKPIVRRLRLVGVQNLSEAHLLDETPAMRTRTDGLYNPHWIRQDTEAIREKYLAEGYLFVRVTPEVQEKEDGVYVTFLIVEGTLVRIQEVAFTGNTAIPDGELLGLMSTREKDFWFFGLVRPGFYDHETLETDLKTLRTQYQRHGYHDVKVELESVEPDVAKEWLRIVIRIEEGPQYIFQGYRFSGNAVFSSQTLAELTTAPVGKPYNADRMERDLDAISNYYGDRAYIFADVAPSFEHAYDKPDVYVRFKVTEGNETYIEEIRIRGNKRTQDRVIRRELELYPGERIDRSKIIKSRSNLARLGIFKDIRYSYEPGSSPAYKDLVFDVEESETGQLQVGVGVTSGFGFLGNLRITKQNFDITDLPNSLYEIPDRFTGAGQTFDLLLSPGTRRSLYRFMFVEPYLFDTRNSFTLAASSLDFRREDWDEGRATFAPRVGHAFDFDRDFVVSIGLRAEDVEVTDIDDDAPSDVFAAKGHTTVLALNTTVSYDKVFHEPFEGPYEGHRESIFYEYAGGFLGGHVDFHKVEVRNGFYFPLYVQRPENLHHVIAVLNTFGVIEPHDSGDSIPIFERFFLGGPFTVKGFEFRGLGPHENRSPVGGTAELYGTVEYSFPLLQKYLRGVFFLDYGNLAPDLSEFTFDEMRYAAGGGLRIIFPFLGPPIPIGLYLGWPIQKEPDDESRAFLFTVGGRF